MAQGVVSSSLQARNFLDLPYMQTTDHHEPSSTLASNASPPLTMPYKGGRIFVNTIIAVLVLAFIFIFTGLFYRGGIVLREQNITGVIKDAISSAFDPPKYSTSTCHSATTTVTIHETLTSFTSTAVLTVRPRAEPFDERESRGVYVCRDTYLKTAQRRRGPDGQARRSKTVIGCLW